ncbi:MAG: coenzyme F420-0:L-glutamate ligase [Quadrisphaera sp.]
MSTPHPGPPPSASTPPLPPAEVVALSVPGLPEVGPGDDLAGLLARACAAAGIALGAEDVVVVASKVVAKAEGRSVPAAMRERALDRESVRLVAERGLPDGRTTRVVQSRSGPVMAAAGIDASDVAEGTVLLLPADPDASARALRTRLRALLEPTLGGRAPAVVVSDTSGRPWRDGVTDFALGAAGLEVLDDARGRLDRSGRVMEVTVRGVADEVAALADLVKGKAAGTPVAVVRGLGAHVTDDDGDGAARLVRTGPADWFAFGHVEAVRAALGLAEREVAPPAHRPPAVRCASGWRGPWTWRQPGAVSVRPPSRRTATRSRSAGPRTTSARRWSACARPCGPSAWRRTWLPVRCGRSTARSSWTPPWPSSCERASAPERRGVPARPLTRSSPDPLVPLTRSSPDPVDPADSAGRPARPAAAGDRGQSWR